MKIRVKAFGPLRDFMDQPIEVDWKQGFTAAQCLRAVEEHLIRHQLVSEAPKKIRLHQILSETVLAQAGVILAMNEALREQAEVALLPPVCGG